MSSADNPIPYLIVFGLVGLVVLGFYLGRWDAEAEAVEFGYAHYHHKTGDWQWNPTPTPTLSPERE